MLQQAVNHIDHVAIVVYPENVEAYVEKLSRVLGITFSPASRNDVLGVIAAVSWDSGIEIIAPTNKEGPNWRRLESHGEGTVTIIFGVKDFDAAVRRAQDNGVTVSPEVTLVGNEPWRERFGAFREAKLEPMFGVTFMLGQIEPRY